ncbi:MAG: arylsulfatase, partial [Verrucomicrobiota bacterium]
VMTDDQGYGDLGATGNDVIDTPNIDAMAQASASLKRFYVSPVCSPTRASLMTGRYNYRTRVVDTWIGRSNMDPDEVTIAELLHDAGYATGIFGKWHLGDCYPMRAIDQGFQEALIHNGGGIAQPSEPVDNQRAYTDPILFHNGKQKQTQGYCTDVYFDGALDWIDTSHKAGKPFFIYLADNVPHGPFHDVPEALYKKYLEDTDLTPILNGNQRQKDIVARVFAMIENVDLNMGRLFKKLDALKIADDTIVIFMIDNGPNTRRYNAGFRNQKTSVYEGGIRSPFFIRWPARLKAGHTVDELAAHIDVMPTLLAAAEVPLPKGLKIDGRNLLPALRGLRTERTPRTLFIQTHRGNQPVRYHHFMARDDRWKLVRTSGFGREQPPADHPFELFDLQNDKSETKNLAAEHPDIVKRLKAEYDAWFDDVSSTRKNNYAPPRIVIGTDHETETLLSKQDWRDVKGPGWGTTGQWYVRADRKAVYDATIVFLQPRT